MAKKIGARGTAVVFYGPENRCFGHVQWAHRRPQMLEICGHAPCEFKGRACPLLGLLRNPKARAGQDILRGRDVPGLVERTIRQGV